eukprot:CAMPEP_0170400020 /NCGR_PEP_ID=MMETSP0117_2-20130122/24272_1 /TAXON_ID=400756 /ORGANISM="Durinskia baltica, Strain CSIRO CS-38" /LENGTH=76 /DNA_ID=CAMNT_0010656735 /DNA_START=39 /DNA_END=266 /DNA_ORIENTATION=+
MRMQASNKIAQEQRHRAGSRERSRGYVPVNLQANSAVSKPGPRAAPANLWRASGCDTGHDYRKCESAPPDPNMERM